MNAHAEFDTDRVRIHVHHARTWWQRARGLIAHPEPRHGAGMFFPKTNAVHGMGMAHALDIVFLDRDSEGAALLSSTTLRDADLSPCPCGAGASGR